MALFVLAMPVGLADPEFIGDLRMLDVVGLVADSPVVPLFPHLHGLGFLELTGDEESCSVVEISVIFFALTIWGELVEFLGNLLVELDSLVLLLRI